MTNICKGRIMNTIPDYLFIIHRLRYNGTYQEEAKARGCADIIKYYKCATFKTCNLS